LILCLLAPTPAPADEPVETSCAAITRESNGAPATVPMENLKVIEQTAKAGAFKLPRGAPKVVQAVICKRSSIVPAAHDDKVPRSGYTLYVTDELGRVAALGLVDGQLQFDVLDGALTEAEQAQASARLREFGASNQPAR
jgi:hypothetical protein